jgi:uncharacterized membrane protein
MWASTVVQPLSEHIMQGRIGVLTLALLCQCVQSRAASITTLPVAAIRLLPNGEGVLTVQDGKVLRWTKREGYTHIGTIPKPQGANLYPELWRIDDISVDGKTVVGRLPHGTGQEVFRWTATDGLHPIGLSPGPYEFNGITQVSDDGSVVAGRFRVGSEFKTFAWTEHAGLIFPETPAPMTALSGDGKTIAGGPGWPPMSYVWTASTGTKVIEPPPRKVFTNITGLTYDGRALFGELSDYENGRAFRWTEGFGVQELGSLGIFSSPQAASRDGSVIVGKYLESNAQRIFYWNEADGMRPLHEVLRALGVEMTPASFSPNADFLLDVSDDGSVILGMSHRINPNGPVPVPFIWEYWIADLSTAVPEPRTWALIAVVAAGMCRRFPPTPSPPRADGMSSSA